MIDAYKKKFQEELAPILGNGSSVEEGGMKAGINLELNMTEADKQLDQFIEKAKKPIELTSDASDIVSEASSALERVKAMFSQTFTINAEANITYNYEYVGDPYEEEVEDDDDKSSGSTFLSMSKGGHFTKPTYVQVAEDGDDEYIIPVKKESRAIPLLKQLINDLSPEARKALSFDPGIRGASVSDLGGASVNSVQNNSNVSAPVTINVSASGASADRIGESIYNTAERYLLRTMKGVFA